jgi:hypothetical protein
MTYQLDDVKYLDDPAKWPVLADKLRQAKEFGFDTETYGQEQKQSPQHRCRIHCWSVAWLAGPVTSRGFRRAMGVVLPRIALDSPHLREVFADRSIAKWAHNAPHDIHSTRNEGIEINGCQDSLQWYRVAFPGMKGYGLKQIAQWALGYNERPTFKDMIIYQDEVIKARGKNEKGCICGAKPCHQRGTKEFLDDDGLYKFHKRVEWRRFTPIHKMVESKYSVTDFSPERVLQPLVWRGITYDRFRAWLNYSVEDAIQGIEAVDFIRRHKYKEIKYPWGKYGFS